ncbi:MAG TPA: hypothetical protein DIW81_07195 [Planctomycetaceae bacterium]|nr:hypothetical protein [Planctomycetaceae bacterium]|tara:strand:+ start:10116 stop:11081 length:966 start_codon:yes stop_codon:yes gene_type:complete
MENSMSRLLLLLSCLIALLALTACSQQSPAQEITIGFWNVQNLLDEFDDPLLPYDEKFSPSSVQERLGKDAEVIRSLNADIIGLAEVENASILKRLVSGYLSKNGYDYYALLEGDDPRGIDCAIISRFPFLARSVDIPDLPRDLLVARFASNGTPFYVVVCHWKSRRDGNNEDVRLSCTKASATCVKEIITSYEGRTVPVVLVGDFNDTPQNQSLKYLEQQGLTNTMLSIPEDARWTIGYFNRDENNMDLDCFDQILINASARQGDILRWKSTKVHRPNFMINDRRAFNGVKIPLPIDDYNERIGYSDHFPVVATFELVQP